MSSDPLHSYRVTTLSNGTRIASVEMPHMRSACVGLWVGVGGRYEPKALSGMSHFTEHLLFKGTKARSAKKITEAVEGLGGYLNAFTTEDHTCYYAKAAARHLPVVCDVLSDMYLHSQFAPVEIERERDVICEEIAMVTDNPSQYVQEMLSEALWPDHPLGRSLTGTAEGISRFTREHFLDFTRRFYNGRTTIVAVAGCVTHDCVLEAFAPVMEELPKGRTPSCRRFEDEETPDGQPRVVVVPQEIEQCHLAMGWYAFGRRDPRRFALKILSVILGENMSSRLFQKLRERYGFCYSIHSCLVSLDDTGALTVSSALDPDNLRKAISVILQEVERIGRQPPSRSELRKAQDYLIGQTLMGLESTTNQMMWMGESLLAYGKVVDPAEVERQLCAVTPQEIAEVARHCLVRSRLCVSLVGSGLDADTVRSWL